MSVDASVWIALFGVGGTLLATVLTNRANQKSAKANADARLKELEAGSKHQLRAAAFEHKLSAYLDYLQVMADFDALLLAIERRLLEGFSPHQLKNEFDRYDAVVQRWGKTLVSIRLLSNSAISDMTDAVYNRYILEFTNLRKSYENGTLVAARPVRPHRETVQEALREMMQRDLTVHDPERIREAAPMVAFQRMYYPASSSWPEEADNGSTPNWQRDELM